jgi:hypothetical protein
MSQADVRVFVNERGVSVPAGSTALAAVRALFPDDADGIEAGRLRLTDSHGGAIYRVVTARERLEDASA